MQLLLAIVALIGAQDAAPQRDLYRAQMYAAESALRLGEFAAARAWLDETPEALRGFEWRVLDTSLDQSLASIELGESHAYAIDTSPDGARVACGLADGALELRKLDDGALVWRVEAHAESLSDVDFSADGRRLVTASFDRTVKVFDAATGAQLVSFDKHGFPVGGATFSPDGALIASCSYERRPECVVGILHLWNSADGELVRTLEGGRKPLVGIEFSPDGQHVAAGSWNFCVFVWNVSGGAPLECAMPDDGIYNAVDGCAFSPDGALIAGASKDHTARVWNARTGELVATLRGHTDYVSKLAFAPDGKHVATVSNDATARLWSVDDWSSRAVLQGHAQAIEDVRFTADGARLVTSAQDGSLRTWDTHPSWYGGVKLTTTGAAYVARFSPDDTRLASCGYDGRIQLWSTASWELLASWQAHPDGGKSCHALGWTGDGRKLVSGSWEPVVRVWDAVTLEQVASFDQAEGTSDLAVSADGTLVATASGKHVHVWDLAGKQIVHTFAGHASTALAVNFSSDSKLCVSTGRDGKALVWNARTGVTQCSITARSPDVAEAIFTPDGSQVVVAERGGRVALHAASDGALVRELAHHAHGIEHIDLSPDASRVAIASNVVGLLDLAHGRLLASLRPHREHPYNVDFDARGERLASCSTDKTIVIIDTRPLRERLHERDARLAARANASRHVETALREGQSLAVLAGDVLASREPGETQRALLDELTRRAGATKP